MSYFNREKYLARAIQELRPWFKANGYPYKKTIYVSVGHTKIKNAIGITHKSVSSSDGNNHVFISPTINETKKVLSTLVHEIAHCIDDCANSHQGTFIDIAKAVGLNRPWTRTTASDRLTTELERIVEKIGEYKSPILTAAVKENKQSTRMIKIRCSQCGWIGRASQKWIDVALPICGYCGIEMELG